MHRSVTDLSVDLNEEVLAQVAGGLGGSMEIHKEQVVVKEVEVA